MKSMNKRQSNTVDPLTTQRIMKRLELINFTIILLAYRATAFSGPAPTFRVQRSSLLLSSSTAEYTLEGKAIQKPFTPVNNMLLLKKGDIVDQTGGGIFLTGKAKIDKTEGVVVAVGPGRTNQETGFHYPMPIALGEKVIYGQFDGQDLIYNGVKHVMIRDDDILVKFKAGSEPNLNAADVIGDNVLVKVIKAKENISTGGILVAKTTKKAATSSIGEVVKVGPGRFAFNGSLMGMDVAVGDMVKFRDFSAEDVEINKETFAVLKMTDILAKF